MARAGGERGLEVVALDCPAYSQGVDSPHPSGKKLYELADVVLDKGTIPGDAAVEVASVPWKAGPTSVVVGITIMWALMIEIVATLVERE